MNFFKKTSYFFKRTWNKIRYGMALQVIRDRLVKIGIEITPYYLILENSAKTTLTEPPAGDFSEYSVEFFGPKELKIMAAIPGREYIHEEYMLSILDQGKKCLGVKHKGQIACFMWFDFDECAFKETKFTLKENEACLFDLYTLKPFRGKQLAPYLRYHCYQTLESMGKNTYYSITEWYNKPSMKFKKKLNARFLELCLSIKLFGKYRWHWTIKQYE